MKFLANENFPLKSVVYLRMKGHDVVFEPEGPGKIIVSLIDEMRFIPDQCLTIVDEKGYRQRKY